jgi:hypothetical protein
VITSSKTKRAPGACAQVAEQLEEPGIGRDEAHVGGDRLDEHRREVVAVLGEGGLDAGAVVERDHHRVGDGRGRDPRAPGEAERGDAAAGGHEQRIEVAVVAAGELQDLGPVGGTAREAHGGHRGFGARRDQPHLFDRRDAVGDRLGELDFAWGGRAERRAVGRGAPHRVDDAGCA